jgi:hypothetical protein
MVSSSAGRDGRDWSSNSARTPAAVRGFQPFSLTNPAGLRKLTTVNFSAAPRMTGLAGGERENKRMCFEG